MSKNKKASTKKGAIITGILALAGVGLLAGSAIGNTNAALTIVSEDYVTQAEAFHIGVEIVGDDDKAVKGKDDKEWTNLFGNIFTEDDVIVPGLMYDNPYSLKNTGTIDEYVRITIRRFWIDENGNKITTLSPHLIDLGFQTGNGWVIDPDTEDVKNPENDPMPETTVMYFTRPIAPDETTPAFAAGLRIDNEVEDSIHYSMTGNTITVTYDYDGATFVVEAEADGIQTHNSVAAIKSTWGIDPDELGIQPTE